MMNKLIIFLQLLIEFAVAGTLIYFGAMWTFPTTMINLMLFIPGFFVLVYAHDKLNQLLDKKDK